MATSPPPKDKPGIDPSLRPMVAEHVADVVPHNRALGIRLAELGEDTVTLLLPWNDRLVGNPDTRVMHGGAITTLMDATCGTSVILTLMEPLPVATLDLRIDYLRPGRSGEDVHARAHCFKVARNVAFVRCEAFNPAHPTDLVAVANGTFMIFREGQKRRGTRK